MPIISNAVFFDYIFGGRVNAHVEKRVAEYKRRGIKVVPIQDSLKLAISARSDDQVLAEIRTEEAKKAQAYFQDIKDERFRVALRVLGSKDLEQAIYGNVTDKLDDEIVYSFPTDSDIRSQFDSFEKAHHFFTLDQQEQAFKQFMIFFKMAKLVGDFVENNNSEDDSVAYDHAYKILILFGEKLTADKKSEAKAEEGKKYFEHLDVFMKTHNLKEKKMPLHDALFYALPKNQPPTKIIHLEEWRNIIRIKGRRACRLFGKASEIEEQLHDKPPQNFDEAFNVGKLIFYKNFNRYPELGQLCMTYDVSEANFERCLEIDKHRKTADDLPDVAIDGEALGHPGYYLVKLPIGDPRAYVLGQMTDCCQFIGGHGEGCTIDGVTRKSNGFYVLLKEKKHREKRVETKEHKSERSPWKEVNGVKQINYADYDIVGQGYAWKSYRDNLTFDSWENLRPDADDSVVVDMLRGFSKAVVEQKESKILRVTIGKGGKTPGDLSSTCVCEIMKEGTSYDDSSLQHQLYINEEKQKSMLTEYQQIINAITNDQKYVSRDQELLARHLTSLSYLEGIKLLYHDPEFKDYCAEDNTPYLFRMLRDYSETIPLHLLGALTVLYKKGLLNKENIDICFCFDKGDLENAVILLDKAGLLTQSNFNFLEAGKDREYGYFLCEIASAIEILSKANLQEYIGGVVKFEKEASIVANGMTMLKRADLLNPKNIAFLQHVPRIAIEAASVLCHLHQHSPGSEFTHQEQKKFRRICDRAVKAAHFPLVSLIYEKTKIKIRDFFWDALESREVNIIKLALSNGAEVNQRDWTGRTTLMHAIKTGNSFETVTALMEAKASPNETSTNGLSPLMVAIESRNSAAVEALLMRKDLIINNLIIDNYYRHESFSFAIFLTAINEAKLITPENTKLIAKQCERGAVELRKAVEILQEAKLLNAENLNIILNMGESKDELAKLLVDIHNHSLPKNFELIKTFILKTLCHAAGAHFINLLLRLEMIEPNIMFDGLKGSVSLLGEAVWKGNVEVVKLLLAQSVSVNEMKGSYSPLHFAAEDSTVRFSNQNLEVIKVLLAANANVNAIDKNGDTPLHYLMRIPATSDSITAVKLLLAARADCQIKNLIGHVPFNIALDDRMRALLKFEGKSKVADFEAIRFYKSKDAGSSIELKSDPAPSTDEENKLPKNKMD